jgi:hypothetical protein
MIGIAITAPAAMAKRASPSVPWLSPCATWIAGIRDTHVAINAPLIRNNVATATRAAAGRLTSECDGAAIE